MHESLIKLLSETGKQGDRIVSLTKLNRPLSGINIPVINPASVIRELITKGVVKFNSKEDIRKFNRGEGEFTIIDNDGNEFTVRPTAVGHFVNKR